MAVRCLKGISPKGQGVGRGLFIPQQDQSFLLGSEGLGKPWGQPRASWGPLWSEREEAGWGEAMKAELGSTWAVSALK